MASTDQSADQTEREEGKKEVQEEEEEEQTSVQGIQSRYLRCPSPSFSMASMESRFSAISGSDAASIFMEPIHLSSAVAAKKIINEELPPRGVRAESIPESMLESAEQLMVEDLYNRVRDMIDDRSPYNTPCVLDIQRAMVQERLEAPANPVDEVWPNIFIAEKSMAVNKARLKRMGITHVLNAAHGTGVYTGESFYSGMNITYMGIELDDFPDADISTHFRPTAEFLDEALLTHKGKVMVVSMMGASRSAVLVASYLMIFQSMSIMEALTSIRKKRPVNPNEGFLKQLRELNEALMEERDDDDDTISQCSVVDARARARIFGEEEEEEDWEEEEEGSLVEVKARSIMMEEEEDGQSVMSSVASSSAMLMAMQNGVERKEEVRVKVEGEEEEEEEEDGVGSMIREWQCRNEKYQSDDWWEAQLNSDEEEGGGVGDGAESVTSEDVRAVRERVKRRQRRLPADATSTATSCSTYSDLWRQRLREIEEHAAARYARKDEDGEEEEEEGDEEQGSEGGESAALVAGRGRRRKVEDEVESILSDSSSMYNFCQRNKEKMTALERWRVKRIQFGWNKKDREDGGEGGDDVTAATPPTPSLQDVNLTAYQSWKLRQQRRHGGEEDRQEVLELGRGEDSASVKRRQRREEVLERARRTLEESRSVCGWDEQSAVSGTTVPLSAFWAGVGVAGPPAADDARSVLSGRSSDISSVISSVSQPRGQRSATNPPSPPLPTPPPIPVPTVVGPGGEPLVNLASIQSWIANVVTETIKQKQSEMSSCGSSASSILSGRFADDDRASLLSSASCSSILSQGGGRGRASSVLSGAPSSLSRGSALGSTLSSAPSISILGGGRKKITTTSVPLYSLFQDEVDMGKLDAMDKEIKSEMRGRMAAYEKKKILEDNRRSTLYKKKKPRGDGEDEDEEEEDERKRREEEFLKETKKKEKPRRSHGLSGCLNLNPELERNKDTSVDDWLRSVRPPQKRPIPGDNQPDDPYDDLDASASEFDFSSHRESFCLGEEEEEEKYGVTSRLRSQLLLGGVGEGFPSNGISQQRRPYGAHEAAEQRSRKLQEEEDDEDDVAAFIAQTRQRARARAAAEAEAEGDEVLAAWRAQQDAKSQSRSSP
ncbi:serine/threonine/tyrosine-interacting-like protein 2 [Nelusetta ayraudi]|uniref:serine/threonine/tyrosine-interacting-like protein 2 n=1 Tax=Nelusetta ayraudi TaxID=303726 RepID=UPI003F729465